MRTLGLIFFLVSVGVSSAIYDNPSTTRHATSQNVVFGDLGKYLFDKILEQETVIQKLLSDVASLKQQQVSHKDKINALNQQVASLQNENKIIKGQQVSLKSNFRSMKATCSCLRIHSSYNNSTDVRVLKKQVRYLSLSLADLQTEAMKMDKSITDIVDVKMKNISDSLHFDIQNVLESCQRSLTDIVDINIKNVTDIIHSSVLARTGQQQTDVSRKVQESFNKTVMDMMESLSRSEHKQENLSIALASMQKELEDIKYLSLRKDICNMIITDNKPRISFTAGISKEILVETGKPLIFDKIITNNGNGYSSYSGVFTAPVDGTFVFYCTIYTSVSQVRTDMVHNGKTVAQIYAYDSSAAEESSGLVVLNLQKMDHVWIRHYSGGIFSGYYTEYPRGLWTSFSGFML